MSRFAHEWTMICTLILKVFAFTSRSGQKREGKLPLISWFVRWNFSSIRESPNWLQSQIFRKIESKNMSKLYTAIEQHMKFIPSIFGGLIQAFSWDPEKFTWAHYTIWTFEFKNAQFSQSIFLETLFLIGPFFYCLKTTGNNCGEQKKFKIL